MNKFLVRLVDTDYDDKVYMVRVETNKTLKEFEDAYERIRSAWYEEESPDCLWNYLQEKLAEEGFDFYEEAEDLELMY